MKLIKDKIIQHRKNAAMRRRTALRQNTPFGMGRVFTDNHEHH